MRRTPSLSPSASNLEYCRYGPETEKQKMLKMRIRIIQMLMLVGILVAGGATPVTATAAAQEQPASGSTSLTIYSQNLALVRTALDRILEPGYHTVQIDGLPTNFDQHTMMVTNPEVTLMGAHDYRTYQGATTGPGAAIALDVAVAARVDELSLVFLTTGMSWSASYSMIIAPDDASAQIDGYASILNNSGTRFDGADIQLLAGTINQQGAVGGNRYRLEMDEMRALSSVAMAQSPGLTAASFAGYHLYTVSEPLSLLPGEARRIRMWGADSITTAKEYVFVNSFNYHQQYPEPTVQPVVARYRVERPGGTEFGDVALPSGQVRMFQSDAQGRLQLLGIAAIDNTPKEQELMLNTGYAFDIIGTRTQVDYSHPSGNTYESAWRVELRNESEDDVVVQVVERLTGDWTIMQTSHEAEKISAGAVLFRVAVPAGGAAQLEYRVSVRS